jgi:hypothetical protein
MAAYIFDTHKFPCAIANATLRTRLLALLLFHHFHIVILLSICPTTPLRTAAKRSYRMPATASAATEATMISLDLMLASF